tara:strand:+ start:424 stop:582 length:159 start_codon:yes stop_codon:yes gene_type:complete
MKGQQTPRACVAAQQAPSLRSREGKTAFAGCAKRRKTASFSIFVYNFQGLEE